VQGVPQLATAPVPMMSPLSAQGSSEKCDENFPLFKISATTTALRLGLCNSPGFSCSVRKPVDAVVGGRWKLLVAREARRPALVWCRGSKRLHAIVRCGWVAGVQYSVVDMPCDQELDCQLSAFSLSVPCPPCGPPYQATWVRSITQAERAGGKPCSDFLMHSYSSCQPRPVACSALPNTQHCLYNGWPTIQSADAWSAAGDARLPLFAQDAWAVSTRLAWANASEVLSVQTSGAPIPSSLARVINTQCLNASPSERATCAPMCAECGADVANGVHHECQAVRLPRGGNKLSTCSANAPLAADAAFSSCVAQRLAERAKRSAGTSPQYFDAQAQQWTCPSLCPWVPEVCQWSACDATCSSAQHVPQQSVVRGITQMAPDCSQAELVLEQPCSLSDSLPQCPTMEDCHRCDGTPCGEVSGRGPCSMNTYTGNYRAAARMRHIIRLLAACPRDANGLECGGSLSGICTEEGVCLCNKGLYGATVRVAVSGVVFYHSICASGGGVRRRLVHGSEWHVRRYGRSVRHLHSCGRSRYGGRCRNYGPSR
jgi:hypothetical protein